MFSKVEIPYGAYWSTPFCKWQGPFQGLHSVRFAADVARREMRRRNIDPAIIDHAVLGMTVPQWRSFFGAPWLMSMIGAEHVPGPTVIQACQTGPRSVIAAACEVQLGCASTSLVVTCDRTSNGAFVHYPGDGGAGGKPAVEAWLVDNFSEAPDLGHSMLQTAENVASKWGISRSEQHDVVLCRYQQYADAVANDHAFQHRYMSLPFEVPDRSFKRVADRIEGDTGIAETSRDAVDRLKPVLDGGTVTFASQTHPADGNTAILVTHTDKAKEVSADPGIKITIAGFGQSRAEPAHMPVAPVHAAKAALEQAGLGLSDIAAVKSHNPFIVNDIVFARETGYAVERMNNFGCSLVFGHPQGPTGTRLMIELIEELVTRGGGYGLYHGCAAGDSGFAVVLEVRDRRTSTGYSKK